MEIQTRTARKTTGLFYGECVYCTSKNCGSCQRRMLASGEICQSDADNILPVSDDTRYSLLFVKGGRLNVVNW